jgi:hypothetical protein
MGLLPLFQPTLYPPEAAGPLGLDSAIEFGKLTVFAVNKIVHAGLARLFEAAMFNGVICETADDQPRFEISA